MPEENKNKKTIKTGYKKGNVQKTLETTGLAYDNYELQKQQKRMPHNPQQYLDKMIEVGAIEEEHEDGTYDRNFYNPNLDRDKNKQRKMDSLLVDEIHGTSFEVSEGKEIINDIQKPLATTPSGMNDDLTRAHNATFDLPTLDRIDLATTGLSPEELEAAEKEEAEFLKANTKSKVVKEEGKEKDKKETKTTNIKVEFDQLIKEYQPDTDSYNIEVMGMPIEAKLHFKKSFGKVRGEVDDEPDKVEIFIHGKNINNFAPELLGSMSREINKELRDMNNMSQPTLQIYRKSDKIQQAFSTAFEGRDWDDLIESQKPEYESEADYRDAEGLRAHREEDKMIAVGAGVVALTTAAAITAAPVLLVGAGALVIFSLVLASGKNVEVEVKIPDDALSKRMADAEKKLKDMSYQEIQEATKNTSHSI